MFQTPRRETPAASVVSRLSQSGKCSSTILLNNLNVMNVIDPRCVDKFVELLNMKKLFLVAKGGDIAGLSDSAVVTTSLPMNVACKFGFR